MDITAIQNTTVEVESYQATFLVLKIDHQLFRFDLVDKMEFKLKRETQGQLYIYETHPLLIDYNENMATTYINSKPDSLEDFVADVEHSINEITKGWRSWTSYVTDTNINFTLNSFLSNVRSGSGILMEAPFSITQKVIEVCKRYKVATRTFGNELKQDNFKLLLIADNYVIAKEFKLHKI